MLERLLENYKVKLLSFVAAFVFWFVVASDNEYKYTIYVPIKDGKIAKDKILLSDLPERALVRFTGKGKALLALRFLEEASLVVDLTHVYSDGPIPVTKDMIQFNRGGHNIREWEILEPDTIYVRLARKGHKRVPVVPDIEVQPVPGYTVVGGVQVSPDTVNLDGPINYIESVQKVTTERRVFKEVKYRFSGRVRIKPLPDSLKISILPQEVHYSVDIQKLLELTFEEIPIKVVNAPRGWRVGAVPSTLKLTLAGGERLLIQLDKKDIQAIIDYRQDRISSKEGYRVQVKLPPGIRIVQMHPQRFKLVKERQGRR